MQIATSIKDNKRAELFSLTEANIRLSVPETETKAQRKKSSSLKLI